MPKKCLKDEEIDLWFERLMEFESILSKWKLEFNVDTKWEYANLLHIDISYNLTIRYGINDILKEIDNDHPRTDSRRTRLNQLVSR